MIVQHRCVCGEWLRFVRGRNRAQQGRYEPLAGSTAAVVGHVVATVVVDGAVRVVRPDAVCEAAVDGLAVRRVVVKSPGLRRMDHAPA